MKYEKPIMDILELKGTGYYDVITSSPNTLVPGGKTDDLTLEDDWCQE